MTTEEAEALLGVRSNENGTYNIEDIIQGGNRIAWKAGIYAGVPMLVPGMQIELEPTYPLPSFAQYEPTGDEEPQRKPHPDVAAVLETHDQRSSFWSTHLKCWVSVMEHRETHRIQALCGGSTRPSHKLDSVLTTMGAAVAWSLPAELRAMTNLSDMITQHAMHCYITTGGFLETSPRSGVHYLFRRLRPTVALKASGERLRFLAALCMHPIGYYVGTYAGVMVPTDDLIAHLVMMRGDEPMFWKRSNQHQMDSPNNGL